MSDKLPHERLRDWVEIAERKDVFTSAIMDRDLVYGLGKDPKVIEAEAFRKLASEIEQCYVPWPRFGNGEPAQIGDVFESPTGVQVRIDGVTVFDWGYRIECGQEGKAWLDLPYGEMLKRPSTNKVLDAYGIEIKEWDRVSGKGREEHVYTVLAPHSVNEAVGKRFSVKCYDHNDGELVWCDPSTLAHCDPDSLDKLLDDMLEEIGSGNSSVDVLMAGYACRLIALFEKVK